MDDTSVSEVSSKIFSATDAQELPHLIMEAVRDVQARQAERIDEETKKIFSGGITLETAEQAIAVCQQTLCLCSVPTSSAQPRTQPAVDPEGTVDFAVVGEVHAQIEPAVVPKVPEEVIGFSIVTMNEVESRAEPAVVPEGTIDFSVMTKIDDEVEPMDLSNDDAELLLDMKRMMSDESSGSEQATGTEEESSEHDVQPAVEEKKSTKKRERNEGSDDNGSVSSDVETTDESSASGDVKSGVIELNAPPQVEATVGDVNREVTSGQKKGKVVVKKDKVKSKTRASALHDELVALLPVHAMEENSGSNIFDMQMADNSKDIANQIVEIDGRMGMSKIRIYSMMGRFISHFRKNGGNMSDLKKLLNCQKRNLDYYTAAYDFCEAYPMMLFYKGSWSSIRGKFKNLRDHIKTQKTSDLWELPEGCPNKELVKRILGQ